MQKRGLLALAVCLVAIIAISLVAWNLLTTQGSPKYEININRQFSTPQEEAAITAAESINYTDITLLQRFEGSGDPEAYGEKTGIYLSYTYANFIDQQTIDYYQTRCSNQKEQFSFNSPKTIALTYEANATLYSAFRIYNSPAPVGVGWHNVTIVKSTPNGLVPFNSGNMQFFYRNQSEFLMTQWDYDFNFTNCYVVEMGLHYSEYYGPSAGFSSDVYQIVVLDKNFSAALIGVEATGIIS